MSNDIVLEEWAYGKLNRRQIKKQMALMHDLVRPMFRNGEHLSSHTDVAELSEPPFIRRSTCSDTDCRATRAGHIYL